MTNRIRLRRRRSLEQADYEQDDHEAQADHSYIDTNTTDPEWEQEYGIENHDACSSAPCHNGGECHLGRAIHGFAAELLDDEDNIHFSGRNTTFHCKCPPGWTGLACEIKLVDCPAENQTCFNEKKCILSEDDYGMPFRHCECDAQQTDFTLPYVAHFCGQTATVSCSSQQSISGSGHGSFCKNGGKCLDVLANSQQSHAGCECTAGWEGPHCAHRAGTYPQAPQQVEKKDKVAFSLFGLGIAIYILGTVWFYNRKRRRQQQSSNRSSSPSRRPSKRRSGDNDKLDYDAFLDEYESSNDYREQDSSFDLMSYKSKSYSDFEASEGEYGSSDDDEEGAIEGYNDEAEEEESYESSSDEESDEEGDESQSSPLYDDPGDVASPLFSEPKTVSSLLC